VKLPGFNLPASAIGPDVVSPSDTGLYSPSTVYCLGLPHRIRVTEFAITEFDIVGVVV
jgi:hypothetical protein